MTYMLTIDFDSHIDLKSGNLYCTTHYLLTQLLTMKRKKVFFIIALLCMGFSGLFAQQSANAAGGDASGSGGSASYSVGQVVYTYASGTTGSSNQGVQQPYEFFTTGIDDNKAISLMLSAFPNPTQFTVNLKVENGDFEGLSFQLFDISGQQLLNEKVANALTVVPMQTLAAGSYLLRVTDAVKAVKTFTIIKTTK
jgi:hypothetical protein